MAIFLLKRLFSMSITFVLITMLIFFIIKVTPGNPFSIFDKGSEKTISRLTPSDYEALMKKYALDKPIFIQYKNWLFSLLNGSLGDSFSERRPVINVILERLPNTLFLNLFSLLLIFTIALPVGFYASLKKDSKFDKISNVFFCFLYSIPSYWIATLLIFLLGVKLKIFPTFGMHSDNYEEFGFLRNFLDLVHHSFLPAFCMSLASIAFLSRFTRSVVLDVLKQDFIKTAKAKGLKKREIFFRHILKNSLIPFVTLFGLILPELVAGSVIIESIFSWPGLGQLYIKSVYTRDYPVIMAMSALTSLLVLLGSLITDLFYFLVDPRTRSVID